MATDHNTVRGKVIKVLPSARFEVELEDGTVIPAVISGKMRSFNIRCIENDAVTLVISPAGDRARIVRRL